MNFETLSLKQELTRNLDHLNFKSMTPIQEKSLPIVLKGKDVIAQAKTGSGKTAAFALGILNALKIENSRTQSFILCPTRELAEQVAKEIRTLGRLIPNVKVLTLTGGVSQYHQEKSLGYGAHIIVGTPGRVLKLLTTGKLNLRMVKTLVFDEADRMLDMGFHEDICSIMNYLPSKKQTLLFSATFPDGIVDLSHKFQDEPIKIEVDTKHAENIIHQRFYEVRKHQDKEASLLNIIQKYNLQRLIIFCKTKIITDQLANFLTKAGIEACAIHGDLDQNTRVSILTKFLNSSLTALVATDVAARGLDIEDLPAVVNFDLPNDPEVYVHRIGRTGRAGKKGLAVSFYVPKEEFKIDSIEELTGLSCNKELLENIEYDQNFNYPPMKTLYIGGGKKDKLRPGDILGALTGEAKLNADDVGNISILNIISYVAIKREKAEEAMNRLNSGKIKNRRFKVGPA